MSDFMYFHFSVVIVPGLWDIFYQDLYILSVYLYSVIHDYIYTLFTSSYISIVYIFIFSIVISFPLFILSLSFSLYLLDLSLTETVKQTYGQWLVYGEFNTLEFVSRPWLAYKFQGRYIIEVGSSLDDVYC